MGKPWTPHPPQIQAISDPYPEHKKLAAISDQSNMIGAFLDWLTNEQHRAITQWRDDWEQEEHCPGGAGFSARYLNGVLGHREEDHSSCQRCNGTGYVLYKHAGWAPDGRDINHLLADYFGIDRDQLEAEKRAMLDSLRATQEVEG